MRKNEDCDDGNYDNSNKLGKWSDEDDAIRLIMIMLNVRDSDDDGGGGGGGGEEEKEKIEDKCEI